MDRKQQQTDFLYHIGLVLRPIIEVIEQPSKFDTAERASVQARFQTDHQKLHNALYEFCMGEPGAQYQAEWGEMSALSGRIEQLVRQHLVTSPNRLQDEIEKARQELVTIILAVPVTVDSTIFEARTPFTAYCRMRELSGAARSSMLYCDRYVSHTLFHRLFEHVPDSAQITVVTWPRSKHKNPTEYDKFIDVSKLFAKERPTSYRLLVKPDFHDRWLQCDNLLFHSAGRPRTLLTPRCSPSPGSM